MPLRRQRRQRLSLDQQTADGRPLHEMIAATDAIEAAANVIDDRGEAEYAARDTAADIITEICSLPLVSPQQKLIIGARLALLGIGAEPSHHAVARLLGWDAASGPAKVSTQWNRLVRRLRKAQADGELRSVPAA